MRYAIRWMMTAVVAAGMSGCQQMSLMRRPMVPKSLQADPAPLAAQPAPQPSLPPAATNNGQASYLAASAVRADEDTPAGGGVEAALEWSRKYAEAAEALLQARQDSKKLAEDNQRLQAETLKAQTQLEQSRKELAEANEMLVELGKELREWKRNVLGFREEMMRADQAQLEAIRKILVLLGGEIAPAGASRPVNVSAKDARDANKGPEG